MHVKVVWRDSLLPCIFFPLQKIFSLQGGNGLPAHHFGITLAIPALWFSFAALQTTLEKKKKKPVKYLIFGAKVKGLRPYHLLQIRKTQTKQPNPLQLCNKPSRQIPFPMFLCLYFLKKKDFSANTGNTEGVWTSIGGGGEEKEKGKDQDTRAAAAAREGNHAPH